MGKGSRSWFRRQAIKSKKQRVVSGLQLVEATIPPPFTNGPRRLTGSAAKGKTYEYKVCAMLDALARAGSIKGELFLGPWFKFIDDNGPGLAQPDALIHYDSHTLVIEAKLKQTKAAIPQLQLYGALAERLIGKPWVGVQTFKYPSEKRDNLSWIQDVLLLQERIIQGNVSPGCIFNLHWLGG